MTSHPRSTTPVSRPASSGRGLTASGSLPAGRDVPGNDGAQAVAPATGAS